MALARRTDPPPAAALPLRAKAIARPKLPAVAPLRAGAAPRRLGEARARAREAWGAHLAERLVAAGLSNSDVAHALDNRSERFGAEVRSGAAPITPGEVALLLPLDVGALALVDVVRDTILREVVEETTPEDRRSFLRIALTHLDAAIACVRTKV